MSREPVGDEFRPSGRGPGCTAQVKLSGERLRQVVEAAGRRVLKAQQDNAIAVTWHAEDCVVPGSETSKRHAFTRAATA